MAAALSVVFVGITVLYLVTTFVMIQDIRDNTRKTVKLLERIADDRDSDAETG